VTGRRLALAALLCSVTAPLAAQSPTGRLAGRFPADAVQRLGALIDSFTVAGAPTDPLVLKAIEGASKGASADRVEGAVRGLGTALVQARQALGPDAGARDLAAGAGALRAGARPAALTSLRSARPAGSLAVPLGTLTDLLARGVPAEQAERVIVQLTARSADDAEFGQVAGSVAATSGRSDGGAASGRDKNARKVPPGPPAGVPGNGGRSDPPGKANGNSGNPGNTGKPPNPGRGGNAGNNGNGGRTPSR